MVSLWGNTWILLELVFLSFPGCSCSSRHLHVEGGGGQRPSHLAPPPPLPTRGSTSHHVATPNSCLLSELPTSLWLSRHPHIDRSEALTAQLIMPETWEFYSFTPYTQSLPKSWRVDLLDLRPGLWFLQRHWHHMHVHVAPSLPVSPTSLELVSWLSLLPSAKPFSQLWLLGSCENIH